LTEAPRGGRRDGSRSAAYPGPMAYAGIGMLNAVSLLGGAALGWFGDHELGTLPLFMMLGLLAGALVGIFGTRSELRRYRRPG